MKTFRMIGMALFAVLMCVNFAACSGDDEEPGDGGDTPEVSKKLLQMDYTGDNNWSKLYFTYDDDQVSSIKEESGYTSNSNIDTNNSTYTWGNNLIVERDNWDTDKYTLTDGLISKTDNVGFTYNSSKQLISQYNLEASNYTYWKQDYTWTNGKLTKIVQTDRDGNIYETIEFTYGNQTCKGFFPLLNEYTDVDYYLTFAHPELAGVRTSYLPTKMVQVQEYDGKTTYEFSYTFDNEGYLKTCTVVYNNSDTTIYSFKWE